MSSAGARVAAVRDALMAAGELVEGDRVIAVDQHAGGWSRHSFTVRVTLVRGGERAYVIRVRPAGALLDTDLGLEYGVYSALESEPIPTPRVHAFEDRPDSPFGGPFVIMEHMPGFAPNMYRRADQVLLAEDWAGPRGIGTDMVNHLAQIHLIDPARLPDQVPKIPFDGVVERWRQVYETRRLLRDPVVEESFAWISERAPQEPWWGLVHGDYRIGNTLIEGGRVQAILDWELAYVGDVRFDLGYLSIPRASGKHLRSRHPLMGTFAELDWFLDRYAARTGRWIDPDTLRTFQMLGIMMLLATQFSAAWMYATGATQDVRMAWSRFSFAGLRQDMIGIMGW